MHSAQCLRGGRRVDAAWVRQGLRAWVVSLGGPGKERPLPQVSLRVQGKPGAEEWV